MISKLFSTRTSSCNRGFTLIELLVVISIISVLSSVAFASFRSAQIKATNTKNIDVIRMYIFALESYRNDFGYFPFGPNVSGIECLSDRAHSGCGYNGMIVENSLLYNALSPYISPTIALDRVYSDNIGTLPPPGYYDGPVYHCTQFVSGEGTCKQVDLEWVQKYTTDTSRCSPGVAVFLRNDIAICRVTVD